MNKKQIKKLSALIQNIEKREFDQADDKGLYGFNGRKSIACIEALTGFFCARGAVYLEIGVFQGLTLLSNASRNTAVRCYGIDNFSLFDEGGKNRSLIGAHLRRLRIKNATVMDCDFEEALESLGDYLGRRKVGVLFVDGPHDYRSQLVALLKVIPYLAEDCAIIIDDANYPHVRQANRDFLKTHDEFALLAEAYTRKHIANMSETEKKRALAGWCNGVNVLVRDKHKRISRRFPREQNNNLFGITHDIFRHEFAEIAFDILRHVQRGRFDELARAVAEHRGRHPQRFPHHNTYSASLERFMLHA